MNSKQNAIVSAFAWYSATTFTGATSGAKQIVTAQNDVPTAITVTPTVKYIQFSGTEDNAIASNHDFYPATYDSGWKTYVVGSSGTPLNDTSNHTADYAAIKVSFEMSGVTGLLDAEARYQISVTIADGSDAASGNQATYSDFAYSLDSGASKANFTGATQVIKNDIVEDDENATYTVLIFLDGEQVNNSNIALGTTTFTVSFSKVSA